MIDGEPAESVVSLTPFYGLPVNVGPVNLGSLHFLREPHERSSTAAAEIQHVAESSRLSAASPHRRDDVLAACLPGVDEAVQAGIAMDAETQGRRSKLCNTDFP